MRRIRAPGDRATRDHPADRQGRGVRPHRRPAARRRRLRGQAVLAGRARRARRRGAAPRRHRRRRQSRRCASAALEIDPAGRRVRVDGEEVALTEREYDLLLFLARHPGRAFTRNQLMDHVWQYAFYTDTSTVTVHIRRLRAKLEPDPETPALDRDGVGRRLPLRAVRRLACGLRLRDRSSRRWWRRGAGSATAPRGARDARDLAPLGCAHGARRRTAARARARGSAACAASSRRRRRRRRRRSRSPSCCSSTQMFVSAHDAFFTVLVAAYAAALSGVGRAAARPPRARRRRRRARRRSRRRRGRARRAHRRRRAATRSRAWRPTSTRWSARLDGEERARRDLFAAVSHDLRTPITALRLLAEAIDDGIVDAETRREYAARMGTHVRALGALIDDLFELTRLESGELTWTMEQVRLDELLQRDGRGDAPRRRRRAVAVTRRGRRRARRARAPTRSSSSACCST